jgi:hypothetical protein
VGKPGFLFEEKSSSRTAQLRKETLFAES